MINITGNTKVFDEGIARARFVYQSVMMTMDRFLVVIFGNGPKMSVATNLRLPLARNRIMWHFFLGSVWL